MIFETHAHYDDAKFDTDGFTAARHFTGDNVGSSIATTKTTLSLAQEYPFFMLRWAYIPVTWMI